MPANTRLLKRRIKSVKNTAQITRAMQMVAASKMRRAQQQAASGNAYSDLMNRMLVELKGRIDAGLHPLLNERHVEKELVLLMTTDRGLCGPLNANLFKAVTTFDRDKTEYVVVGRKGRQFLARTKRNLRADFEVGDPVNYNQSRRVSRYCMELFLEGTVDRVRVVFPKFVNTLVQETRMETILPISPIKMQRESELAAGTADDAVTGYGYLFEPSAEAVLESLVPSYVHYLIYQMFLDARASEHSARMVAMKSATDNAKELVKDLTLEYNKARQAAITNEIAEIATAQLAMA
jgi:F-type H+-transporting ATPase subunit gamma